MIELVYVSSAVRPFTTEQLTALLEKSRQNNGHDGLTGMLLYKDGNFMQALEGRRRPSTPFTPGSPPTPGTAG